MHFFTCLFFIYLSSLLPLPHTHTCVSAVSSVSPDTVVALNDLYFNTNGSSWSYPSGVVKWNFTDLNTVDPCVQMWAGITCTKSASTCLGSVCDVAEIDLSSYKMEGQLPDSLTKLTALSSIRLSRNSLSGYIPWSVLYSLTRLSFLYLNENLLQGSLPDDIDKLAHINLLQLRQNKIVGTIPEAFGGVSNLGEVHFSLNRLRGTIPSSIQRLSRLYYISLRNNQLVGTIPSIVGVLTNLVQFSVYGNKMVGTLPPELGKLKKLEFLLTNTNSLSGTIPPEVGNATSLRVLSLHTNSFSGPIPPSLCRMEKLLELDISNNEITSTIPGCVASLSGLESLNLHHNQLVGSLPPTGYKLDKLLELDISYNSLSGNLPRGLSKLPRVTTVILQNNRFSGNLDIFGNASLPECTFLSAASNALTGTLPDVLFLLPKLQYLIISKNCFSGKIPDSICLSNTIEVFSMNGLASGSLCNLFRLGHSYFPSHAFRGEIPACLWNMSSLQLLYLSGNLLTGDIESISIPDSSQISVVSLSGNKLEGKIPISLQTREYDYLDLSWNKFTGTLDVMEDFFQDKNSTPKGPIYMSVNYLSGVVPNYLMYGTDVQVLDGNLFECSGGSFQPPRLPRHDPSAQSYACGSSQYDISMLLYALVFVISGAISVCLVYQVPLLKVCVSSLSISLEAKLFLQDKSSFLMLAELNPRPYLKRYLKSLHHFLKTTLMLGLGAILFSIIAIPIMRSEGLSVLTHTYSWYMSYAYLDGAFVYLFMWAGCMGYFSLASVKYVEDITAQSNKGDKALLMSDIDSIEMKNRGDRKTCAELSRSSERMSVVELIAAKMPDDSDLSFTARASIATALNTGCVFAVNWLYVDIVRSDDISQTYKILAQFAVSIFMCFWNSIVVGFMVTRLNPGISQEINVRTLCRVINTIFLPAVAVLFSSSKCFSAFFFGLGEITNTVEYTKCSVQSYSNGVIKCTQYTVANVTDTIERPFVYNGGCTSAIMIDYIPVHIYAYAFDFIVLPVAYLLCTTYFYKLQSIIVLPKVIWVDTKVEGRQLIRSGNLFGIMFGHFALLLTFGLSSSFLIAIILIACVQDVVIYVYYLRTYLYCSDRVKYPWRKGDNTGGLEDACVEVPKKFRFSIFLVMFSSALFNACVALDKLFSETHHDHDSSSHLVDYILFFISPFVLIFILLFVQDRYLDFQSKHGEVKSSPSLP